MQGVVQHRPHLRWGLKGLEFKHRKMKEPPLWRRGFLVLLISREHQCAEAEGA